MAHCRRYTHSFRNRRVSRRLRTHRPRSTTQHRSNGFGEVAELMRQQMWGEEEEEEYSLWSASVVKVFAAHSEPEYALPWQRKEQFSSTSSGVIVKGRGILTNAHCVQDAIQVQVRRCGREKKFTATVMSLGEECDLALLTVADENFWDEAGETGVDDDDDGAVVFGRIPMLKEEVNVVGFPVGGNSVSITSGVVSRIEVSPYAHAGATECELLTIQIDAAINSGNSGGPVFDAEGRCIGLAFQSLKDSDTENIGYVIPLPVIYHFLKDYEVNGTYTGFPRLGICAQNLESSALRHKLGMVGDKHKGVLVTKVYKNSCLEGIVQPGDVLMKFEDFPIANDGTVAFRSGERIAFKFLISQKFIGEEEEEVQVGGDGSELTVLREGKEVTLKCTMDVYHARVPTHFRGAAPPYILLAGLVFTVLSEPLLLDDFGAEYQYEAPTDLLIETFDWERTYPGQQVVVLRQVLATDATLGYEDFEHSVVREFNGVKVKNLAHLAHLLNANTDSFHSFLLKHNLEIVIESARAKAATEEAMDVHNIPSPLSKCLLEALSSEDCKGGIYV